ncbi:MAG: putative sulfate exporter family transporter [Burkholderiales bacterium]
MRSLALRWQGTLNGAWPGVVLACVIAIASAFVAENRGGPTLLYALLLGMALNPVASEGRARGGVDFAARHVLRVGVALLGARITVAQVAALGWRNGALVALVVVATIAFGALAARAFGQTRRLGLLTGGATAICGASAAIAIASVLPRDERSERELVFTVAGVTALSTVAMILYPPLASVLGLGAHETGVFIGATIHDVAQVVGAGYSVSAEVGDYAVLTKMLRVAMLLPVVMVFAMVLHRRRGRDERTDALVPPFLLGFVALIVAGSLGWIPAPIARALNEGSRACLVVAIAAVGLKTSPLEMKKVGARAAALLAAEAAFLAGVVLAAQKLGTSPPFVR